MRKPTDQEVDLTVAAMLRWGVTSAAVVVFVGGLLYLRHPWAGVPDYSHFHVENDSLRSIAGIFTGAVHFDPRNIIQAGLMVLIATPVARVVFCVVGFARQRDLLYVGVSIAVLLVLLYSLGSGAR
ncbi:MAG TPA: DUF1634 domain-containing protein [Terracidiphilus sp.]|jgi:uncharacterized membrane protein|nr:DUF1634 domain-containing protein [Terracidiphilus sp.]